MAFFLLLWLFVSGLPGKELKDLSSFDMSPWVT